MSSTAETAPDERTALLSPHEEQLREHNVPNAVNSTTGSTSTDEEAARPENGDKIDLDSAVGERLAYNDYATIDWLRDLAADTPRLRALYSRPGLRAKIAANLDAVTSYLAVALIGILTALIAYAVDVAEATVADWKYGYCARNILLTRAACCGVDDGREVSPRGGGFAATTGEESCPEFVIWSPKPLGAFVTYAVAALAFGIFSASLTYLTKRPLPTAPNAPTPKYLFMAAGSGIPEIKTILSGFTIPSLLSPFVLLIKALGAIFAVAAGLCLGKEGPFVHIATCVGSIVGSRIPKYATNGRKMRELLSASCAAGLSVAFGAPLGGVLFSYEEISTYFPRKVMWRAFLCSLCAAVVLRGLDPRGRLVLFETRYGTSYQPVHYAVFVGLGLAGGVFGGVFCRANFAWSKWFRGFAVIKMYPVFEVALVVLVTSLVQWPNPMTRDAGDKVIGNLLVDCRTAESKSSFVCTSEDGLERGKYVAWLVYGTLAKLILTIVTFGCKVPSGIIIPALDGGAFFGRLVGQAIGDISPGIFAMVGAGAFLAGVSRMTLSLVVVMFELTGEIEYVVPNMIAIFFAKFSADMIGGREGVYDLAQTVLGHPFLDSDTAMKLVQGHGSVLLARDLIPPLQTMEEITVRVPPIDVVSSRLLVEKLDQLHRRGLMDAGVVLVREGTGIILGYLAQAELEFALKDVREFDVEVRLLHGEHHSSEEQNGKQELDISKFVDRTVPVISANAPMEYVVEMFGKLGLRQLCITEEESGRLIGVVLKKRLVGFVESLER